MAPDKLKRALRSAVRLPARVSGVKSSAIGGRRFNFSPQPNELPLVLLRIQVLGCSSLLAKDKSGSSDPFVVVSLLSTRFQTAVVKRNLNPTYVPRDATFDFPLYLSLADRLGAVELVVWDKDMVGKDYLGEAAIPLEEWWDEEGRVFGWDDVANKPFTVNLVSAKAGTTASGQVHVKLGLVRPAQSQTELDFDEIFSELVKRSRPSLVSAPPTEGVGTIRSHQLEIDFQEDGGLSSDESDSESDDDYVDAPDNNPLKELYTQPQPQAPPPLLTIHPSSPVAGGDTKTPTTSIQRALSASPTGIPPQQAPPSPKSPSLAKKIFPIPLPRRISGLTQSSPSSSSSNSSLSTPAPAVPPSAPVLDPNSGAVVPGTPAPAPEDSLATPLPTQDHVQPRKKSPGARLFRKNWGGSTPTNSGPVTPVTDTADAAPGVEGTVGTLGAKKGRKKRGGDGKGYSLDAPNHEILGIVMLEVLRAEDLPKLKNMTRTGWDMDPFVVISFGKKVFRTRVIRHSLNPTFEEKLLFNVRRYESSFSVQLAVHDWDKLSSNDHIADANFEVRELVDKAPKKDPITQLYDSTHFEHDMIEMKLKLDGGKESSASWESKHNPVIYIRAKYQPYDLLRQRFWRTYLKQYDTDDTNTISHIELTSMLDSLNSTLTRSTLDSFFTSRGKRPQFDELSIDEVILSLETELFRPDEDKRRVDEDGLGDSSVSQTPAGLTDVGKEKVLNLSDMDFSGPPHIQAGTSHETQAAEVALHEAADGTFPAPPSASSYSSSYSSDYGDEDLPITSGQPTGSADNTSSTAASGTLPVPVPTAKVKKTRFRRRPKITKYASTGSGAVSASGSNSGGSGSEDSIERVINIKNCPLCHRPRLSDKAEVDMVTHLAICASQDWGKVDRIMVGNFVTASQAQRKWYTRILSKVSSGDYRLGANSANIIVQNRMTGQLEEEKMQVYVRLGIRLLYKGARSRMEGARARSLLKSLSFKQGLKYDSPHSAADIPGFIEFHNLNVDEIRGTISSFKTFNEFFYRKLKPSARPLEKPDDPCRLVSGADCRLMTFASVDDATRLWIKGREFSIARLLGDEYKSQAEQYIGGALAIFRLAPQDYHRFHSPVEGRIGKMTNIDGEYYTVNPQAIRSALDVYGENVRKIVPIDSPQFGRVMAVCVGAMMVGSIKTTVQEGDWVHRGQEFGYFAFGGSTIVVLFEKGAVAWDEDLLVNGRASLETLVRVGMGIGISQRPQ